MRIILIIFCFFGYTQSFSQIINIFLDADGIKYLNENKHIMQPYKEGLNNIIAIGGTSFEPGSYILKRDIKKVQSYVKKIATSGPLTKYPSTLLKMKNLRILEIYNFEKMPKNLFKKISKYKGLEELSFNFPKKDAEYSFKNLDKLKTLKKISLCGYDFNEIPAQVFELKTLEEINLTQNKIEIWSNKLCFLPNLSKIDFRHNDFKHFPDSLYQDIQCFSKLRIIDFSKNKIDTVPDWVRKSINPTIYW